MAMSPARIITLILGIWLFVSAFLWPHTTQQFTNTWIVGAACAFLALVATTVPAMRYLTAAVAVWLFISAFVLPSDNIGTTWNNALVAIALFFVSLAGAPVGPPRTHAPREA
jgi:hypothetical protein